VPSPRPAPRRLVPHLCALAACFGSLAACGTIYPEDDSSVDYLPSDRTNTDRGALPLGDGLAPTPFSPEVAERCLELEPLMRVAAMEHRVDVGLIAGIIHVESAFRTDAKSKVGARGLMQVMPAVGKRLKCGDLTDPARNIRCGVTILKRFLEHYDDEVILGLSAYNAGYKVPNDALEDNVLPTNYRYVERVLASRVAYLRHGCGQP